MRRLTVGRRADGTAEDERPRLPAIVPLLLPTVIANTLYGAYPIRLPTLEIKRVPLFREGRRELLMSMSVGMCTGTAVTSSP